MKNTNILFKELTELDSIPGNEIEVRNYLISNLSNYADELLKDNLGSISFKKIGNSKGPKILISAHMDEVGFMVSSITKEGFIKFIPTGGWWEQNLLAHKVIITTKENKKLTGIIGSKPPHILSIEERKTSVKLDNMFIDIGVSSKEEAINLGITQGDMITPYQKFEVLSNPNYLLAKAWDNRVGCALNFELLKSLENEKFDNILFSTYTVQEEVGLKGARTISYVINPDIVIAVDVGIGNDIPNGDKEGMELGKGPQILLSDSSLIGHKGLREFILEIAKKNDIPYQISYLKGGSTDAGVMHLAHDGAPSINILIPSRYIHSHSSIIHKQDYINTLKLLKLLVMELNLTSVNDITYKWKKTL